MSTVARRPSWMTDVFSWLENSGLSVPAGIGLVPEVRIEDYVEDSTYVLRAELPGIDPDKDITVEVEDDVLVVKGERRDEKHDKGHRELHYGAFERAVRLPKGADMDAVKATYRDGVLEVQVPFDKESAVGAQRNIPVQREGS